MLSKRKIDNIGDKLKLDQDLNKEELKQLLSWRNSFSSTLDYYHSKLKNKLNHNDISILARRLKRIESIQIKLKRFKTMRLSTLQDVAGLRVVLKDEASLIEAYSKLRGLPTKHKLKRLDDYHNNPKNDGYRGVHLIYQNENSNMVEIQLRTQLEHIWATAVETYGELQNTSFKTGSGNKEWKEFFAFLSSYFAIKENCSPSQEHITMSQKQIRSQLKKFIKKLNVIEHLNASTNSIEVIVNKYNETGRKGKYALLELNLDNKTTSVKLFNKKDVETAIRIYTEREFEIQSNKLNQNIVFVNIDDIEKIESSYPNYFLSTQKLLEILSKIVLNEY